MKKADLWAFGVTLYCLTFNKMPFDLEGTNFDLMEAICNQKIEYREEGLEGGRQISGELLEFLEMLLEKDPARRATLLELKSSRFLNATS